MNTVAEQALITGVHIFRVYDTSSPEAEAIEQRIEACVAQYKLCKSEAERAIHRLQYQSLLKPLERFIKREKVVKNLITTAGRSVLMQRLANTTTYTGIINYGVLGSSATAVANGDTQLGTEVFRKVVASSSYSTNNAFIDFFFAKADTNGTYQEFGTTIDGTASANTGQLFTHALTGGWTKSASESMTVACQYTLS